MIYGTVGSDVHHRQYWFNVSSEIMKYWSINGATNTGIGLNINHNGSGGEGLYIDTSAGARPLQIANSGNG